MKDIELQAERKAFEAWYEAYCMPSEADWFRRDVDDESEYHHAITADAWAAWQARAAVEADRAQRVPDDIVAYVKGIYEFLESVTPAGYAEEAFRLPTSPTRNQTALFDSLPNYTPRGLPPQTGQVGGGKDGGAEAVGLDALLASTPAPAQQEPSPIKAEHKTVTPSGTVVTRLELTDKAKESLRANVTHIPGIAQHQEPPQQERKPMTEEQDRALCEAFCNAASDEYFKARPQLDSDVNRRIFYAGHRKAWLEWQTAHGIKE